MVIFEGEDHLMGKECDGQTVFITSAKKLRIRAPDLGDPGLIDSWSGPSLFFPSCYIWIFIKCRFQAVLKYENLPTLVVIALLMFLPVVHHLAKLVLYREACFLL